MKKDAYYFSHDSNASKDPKILQMLSVYGAEGYGWYWMLIELMREQEDFKLPVDGKYNCNAYAMHLHCTNERLQDYIKDCVDEFHLFQRENGSIFSPSLIRRMEHWIEISTNNRKAAQTRWEKAKSPNAMQMQSKRNARKGKEKKENNNITITTKDNDSGTVVVERSVYKAYEDNIGMLTPMTADELKDLEKQFSEDWIVEAIKIATIGEHRSLAYVKGILNGWKRDGKQTGSKPRKKNRLWEPED